MWKWIGSCLLAVIVLAMVGAWWGYQKVSSSFSPDGSVRVAIAATSARVFSSLSDADSAGTWMAGGHGSTVSTGKHGTFAPGDSIRIDLRSIGGMAGPPVTWKITSVVPGQVIVREIDSPDPKHKFAAVRSDSVTQVGDSTIVTSRLTAVTPATTTSEQMMLSLFRVQSKLELTNLKTRIEGKGSSR